MSVSSSKLKESQKRQFELLSAIESATLTSTDIDSLIQMIKDKTKADREFKFNLLHLQTTIEIKKKRLNSLKIVGTPSEKKKILVKKLKLVTELQIIKNRILTLQSQRLFLNRLVKDFVDTVENASSPQEVDLYIAAIEEAQTRLMGNPKPAANPVMLRKFIKHLALKLEEIKQHEAESKTWFGKVAESIEQIKKSRSSLAKLISDFIPDLKGSKEEADVSLLEQAIKLAKQRLNDAEKNITQKHTKEKIKTDLFFQKKALLEEMSSYAETSKNHFNWRLQFSSITHVIASVFSLLSTAATAAAIIPPANLIASAIGRASEFVFYSSLTAANAADPNTPITSREAAINHFEAMKRYNLAETTTAGVGTLGLVTGFSLLLAGTAPASVPILLLAGTATMMVSNILSTVRSYKEYERANALLIEHPLIKKLTEEQRVKFITDLKQQSTNPNIILTKEQMKEQNEFLRAVHTKEMLEQQYKSKAAGSVGATILTVLAAITFVAAIGFPPVGFAVITALTIAAVATAAYSAYKKYQEKKKATLLQNVNQNIEREDIETTIKTIKLISQVPQSSPELTSKVKSESPKLSADIKSPPPLTGSYSPFPISSPHNSCR